VQDPTHSIVSALPQSKLVPTIRHPIARESAPSLTAFRQAYFGDDLHHRRPVVITGATAGWRALAKWRDLAHLDREFGHRTVPVEIGRPLDDAERAEAQAPVWKERALTLSEFIHSYLLPSSRHDHHRSADGDDEGLPFDQIGYLAQHALIEQLPALQEDFAPPQYCALGELSNINTWLGTSGTVTSLHFDSYDNLLTQVAGYKYVRLYDPSQTPFLYRDAAASDSTDDTTTKPDEKKGKEKNDDDDDDGHGNEEEKGEMMAISAQSAKAQGNFSAVVNIESPDWSRYPLLREAVYTETILGPGEMLFIPQNCWHYVRSLTTSFSLNFWF
jgi:lysine-specific demethylase 8